MLNIATDKNEAVRRKNIPSSVLMPLAIKAFGNSKSAADFFVQPHRLLNDRKPEDVAKTNPDKVRSILNAILYGLPA